VASRATRISPSPVEAPVFDQVLLETLPVALYVCDLDGRLTHYNRRAVALWGRAPEAHAADRGGATFFRPDGTYGADGPMAAVLRGGEPVDGLETVIERPDGTNLTCLVNIAPLRNTRGELIGAINVVQEIATYRATIVGNVAGSDGASPDLENTEKRFRELLDALPAAIYTTDAAGRITFFNEAAVALAGRRPTLGDDQWCVTWRLFHLDGTPMPHAECPMAVALREDRLVRGAEAIAERPDGTRITFMPFPTPLHDASGALVGAVNMLVDITDRKRAEAALQQLNGTLEQRVEAAREEMAATFARLHESEHRFRLLVEGVSDYAIYMLDPDGFVTNWNSGAERIKGYAADEIIGQHFSRFYSEEDRANGLPEQTLAAARRAGTYEAEGRRVRKDGSVFWANVVINVIRDETGAFVGFAKVTRDLTEKRAAEERIRHAQKMEAVGQLTGGVAHDFNNLLTAIVGNLELLATILPAPEQRAQRYVAAALRAASRGSRLTEHLLAFSRRQEIRPEIVEVGRLLRDVSILCQRIVGDGIPIALRLQDDLWTCNVDAAQLEAAILNVSANARDAMNGSGSLTIAAENVATGASDGSDLAAGEYVVLSVTDTGCGMSAAVLSQAFEPFYTTKEVGKGTGLGLSQVYGFAKQSGGAARIESRTGVGTTVRIYLPRKDGPIADSASGEDRGRAAPGSGVTILVVDDDADVREMTVDMLAELGYRILVAANGPEALAILRRHNDVDLLFSDVVMPEGMSGIELARTARRLRPDTKVLLSSGHPGDTQTWSARPEFPFIAKPYRPSTLGRKIADVLAAGIGR
jgi:PAS domain S-box-containing protein